jgi:hypothetical protein
MRRVGGSNLTKEAKEFYNKTLKAEDEEEQGKASMVMDHQY